MILTPSPALVVGQGGSVLTVSSAGLRSHGAMPESGLCNTEEHYTSYNIDTCHA